LSFWWRNPELQPNSDRSKKPSWISVTGITTRIDNVPVKNSKINELVVGFVDALAERASHEVRATEGIRLLRN